MNVSIHFKFSNADCALGLVAHESSLNSEPTAMRCRGFLSTGQMLAHKLKRRAWSLRRAGFSYYKVRKMIEAMRNEI